MKKSIFFVLAALLTFGTFGTFSAPQAHADSPSLSIGISHSGTFQQGDTGAGDIYTLTVTNTSSVPTDGTLVTVQDFLPSGLTATSMGGTGWACNLPFTTTCTRSDVLNAGDSYPVITLAVNISLSAPAFAMNIGMVSGGGFSGPSTRADIASLMAAPGSTPAAFAVTKNTFW